MLDLEKNYAPQRLGTHCQKWDGVKDRFGEEGLLPLWVADMDFRAPDSVQEAIRAMADHGIYGYALPPESYYQAFIQWEQERHGYLVDRSWIRFAPGVVAAIFWFVTLRTAPGDSCLILTPSYYPFMDAVNDLGRKLVCCEMVEDRGCYSVDFAAFERQIVENNVRLYILSSPHNPSGRVFTRDELQTMLDICHRHDVFVVSDEIHQDIVFCGHPHIPSATLCSHQDKLVTLTSASKTFNLAGCQNSFVIIEDPALRQEYDQYVNQIRVRRGSRFGYVAVEAAYRGGAQWLAEVLEIIHGNFAYARDTLLAALPQAVVTPLEGTYLMWVDLGAYVDSAHLRDTIQGKCRLAVDYGDWFRPNPGDTHIRINLATPRANIREAVDRIIEALR